VIVSIGLLGWFGATDLRVMVKQPCTRGSAGSFVAVLSVVSQCDAWPGGCYDCPMEFLGRTTVKKSQAAMSET
jgi:hypothetical protein